MRTNAACNKFELFAFFASLRADFRPTSAHVLQQEVEAAFIEARSRVEASFLGYRLFGVCWVVRRAAPPNTGHNRRLPEEPILLAFDRSRESGDMLAEHLMKTLNGLKELSVTIPGFFADKGPNMQAALPSFRWKANKESCGSATSAARHTQ